MSVQTGEVAPEAPASSRITDKARFRWERLLKDPNPIWMRELRQSARLTRTPFILMSVTVLATLVIAGIGGSVSVTAESDAVGQALYHAFFSIGFFVVAWAGPALAANAVASEREGRTWEAVVLTGIEPKVIARGKFLGAFTEIASYIFMLAPVGALCFLFGGVDSLEVLIGFVYLFVLALLSVAFGLAVSSKMTSSRGAILVTLLLSVPISGAVFGAFGPGLAFAVNELWPRVPKGVPVWLPIAYVRGELGIEYFLILFVVPLVSIALPAWFLYEATVSNLTEPTDDRSSGMKRWFIATVAILTLSAGLATIPFRSESEVYATVVASSAVLLLFFLFCTAVFMGEPLGVSRRIRFRWDADKVGTWRRRLGPGMEITFRLLIVGGLLSIGLVVLTAYLRVRALPSNLFGPLSLHGALRFTSYLAGFFLFSAGLAAWLRARSSNLFAARLIFAVILGALTIVPWIVAAVVGIAAGLNDDSLVIASLSPFFAAVLLESTPRANFELVGLGVGLAYAVIGVMLFLSGAKKAREVVAKWEAHLKRADEVLAAEDALAAEASSEPS